MDVEIAQDSFFPEAIVSATSCRVCMSTNSSMSSIFEGLMDNISEKIAYCTGLQLAKDDGLPSHICDLCLSDLMVAHKFKTTCLNSAEEFHRLLKTKVKKEVIEDLNDIFEDNFFDNFEEDNKCKVETLDELKKTKVRRSQTERKPRAQKTSKVKVKAVVKKEKTKKVKTEKKAIWEAKTSTDCELCELHFDTRKEYVSHRKLVHPKSAFVCEICGKVFRHQSSQSLHQLTHREPRYYCNHCDYRTTYRQDLVTHLRTHTGEKKFTCVYCPMTFRTSSNRLSHTRRIHERETSCRFTCHVCGRAFVDKVAFHQHLDVHGQVKRYECDICNGRFSLRKHWKRHMARQHDIQVPAARSGRRRHDSPRPPLRGEIKYNMQLTVPPNLLPPQNFIP